jgi:hypothetical protein
MASQIDWRAQTPFTINKHIEYPVNCVFAAPIRINWLADGVNPNLPLIPRPTEFPIIWKESPGQPRIGAQVVFQNQKAPWLYGEKPDFKRLIGNGVVGHGA